VYFWKGYRIRISKISGVFSGIATALKDTFGKIKSLFVSPSTTPDFEIVFDDQGNPIAYKITDPAGAAIELPLHALPDGLRINQDGGNLTYLGLDPLTREVNYLDEIGNLTYDSLGIDPFGPVPADFRGLSSLNQFINLTGQAFSSPFGALPLLNFGISQAQATYQLTQDRYQFLRNQAGYGDLSAGSLTAFYTIGDFVGYTPLAESIVGVDTLGRTLSVGERALKFGEFGVGLGLSFIGGSVAAKGGVSAAVRNRVLANIAESQAARNASRFGLEGFNNGVEISRRSALKLLTNRGISADQASKFINSFDGPLTVRRATPGEQFLRYSNFADDRGSFLSNARFNHPSDAILELVLNPSRNSAQYLQVVRSRGTSILLEGRIRGSFTNRNQYLINPDDFDFSRGRYYGFW
jgi:hypothetical protein